MTERLQLSRLTMINKRHILRALDNRVYPRNYNNQIEHLAFDKRNYTQFIMPLYDIRGTRHKN